MKILLGLLLAALACLATAEDGKKTDHKRVFFKDVPRPSAAAAAGGPSSRIYGGNVAGRTQFPYQAALYIDYSVFCGGSLINKQWVLTAGHCVDGFSKWAVHLGVSNMLFSKQEGRQVFISNRAVRHEEYDEDLIINDIAVIQLRREVELSEYISLIKLTPPGKNYAGRTATISGFGLVDDFGTNVISPVLKYTSLPIISNAVCGDTYDYDGYSDASQICLDADETSTCSGDSGGPLVLTEDDELIQVGITSFGSSWGCSYGYPVGFTRVSMFIDWLTATTGVNF